MAGVVTLEVSEVRRDIEVNVLLLAVGGGDSHDIVNAPCMVAKALTEQPSASIMGGKIPVLPTDSITLRGGGYADSGGIRRSWGDANARIPGSRRVDKCDKNVEGCEYEDDSYVYHQPFPEPVLEEQKIDRNHQSCHQDYVKCRGHLLSEVDGAMFVTPNATR